MRRWFWLAVALVWIAVALGAGATSAIRERRVREERLAVLRQLQLDATLRNLESQGRRMRDLLEDQQRYLRDIVEYQKDMAQYLEDKIEGRLSIPPPEPRLIKPVLPVY